MKKILSAVIATMMLLSFGMSQLTALADAPSDVSTGDSEAWGYDTSSLLGDANDDWLINVKDLVRAKRHLADSSVEININTVDFDGDELVGADDLKDIRKILLGN